MTTLVQSASGSPAEHPAARAWVSLVGGRPPERLDLIGRPMRKAKSAVWRMVGGAGDGRTIIAKQAPTESLVVEYRVYNEILVDRGLGLPRCHGIVDVGNGTSWLFLDAVTGVRYTEAEPRHRLAASEWLGAMHQATHARPAGADTLPAVALARYEAYVAFALEKIPPHVRPGVPADARDALVKAADAVTRLREFWPQLQEAWAQSPSCLVHGDFISKNVWVEDIDSRCDVHVIDWEASGWGVPIEDMAGLDADTYWSRASSMWAVAGVEHVRRMTHVGVALRAVAFLSTYARALDEGWYGDADAFAQYASELDDALNAVSD